MKPLRSWLLFAWLVAPAFLARAGAAKDPNPRPYVLFMGTDLSVEREKKLYRVEDVAGSEFKIHVGKHEVFIPTLNRNLTLQVSNRLKLTGTTVKLDNLQSRAAYTPENDPSQKIVEAAVQAAGAETERSLAYSRMTAAESNLGFASTQGSAADVSRAREVLEESQREVAVANSGMMNDLNNVGSNVHRAQVQLDRENFDAIEASFKVSSDVPLEDPYMIVLFKFRDPDAKGNASGLLVHAKSLPPIDGKPRFIRVMEGGMTPGFKLLDCEVHIYNRGEEVPTNVSPKRVELTRDEAQQYLAMEHAGANQGATLPAAAVPGTLPREQRQRLSHEQLTRTVYVKVAEDGSLRGVFADPNCDRVLEDRAVVAALEEVFFRPALSQGKPAEGITRLRLADL